jgi:hypothetical protein
MAEIQENIINRSKIKDSINPNDLPNLSFSIPTDPNTISNSRNEFFAERLRKKEDLN